MENIIRGIKKVYTIVRNFVIENNLGASITGLSWMLVFAFSEEIMEKFSFECPCPNEMNGAYSAIFIFGPAMVIGSIMALQTAAKNISGCACPDCSCKSFFEIIAGACMWIAIVAADGDYFACLATRSPYNTTCDEVDEGKGQYSEEYKRNKDISQIVGWCSVFVVATIYTLSTICCPCETKKNAKQKLEIELGDILKERCEKCVKEAKERLGGTISESDINNKLGFDPNSFANFKEFKQGEEAPNQPSTSKSNQVGVNESTNEKSHLLTSSPT